MTGNSEPEQETFYFGAARPLEGRELSASADTLARILDCADDAIISVDDAQRIILYNQGAGKIFGYAAAEVNGRTLDLLIPERLAGAGEARERREIRARRKDGTEFPAEVSVSRAQVEGEMVSTVILRDITGRALADERVRVSLREKEALLKEIHHRVKNNLQVVSSLLGLQSRMVTDPETRKMFHESQDRIHSMALLHESLYESQNLSQVDFPQYIRQLAAHLFHSYGVGADRIHLRTDMDRLSLSLDAAVPCGLIINELVSNSLKYAFPEGRTGEIRIELRGNPDGTARLLVADNGVGLRADVDWVNTRSLGLRLVRTLAEQMGGKIEVQSVAGTEFRLAFEAAA